MNRTIISARPVVASTIRQQARRTLMTSSPVKGAAAGHDSHGAAAESSDVYTKESFLNSTWRNTLIIGTISYLAYTFLPSPPSIPTSPSSDPAYNRPSEESMPFLSKIMARGTTPAEEWKRRNAKHLEQTVRSAEDRLLFQEAERPRVYRLKNPAYFDTLPPHRRPVGDDVNLKDLVVKNDPALPEVRA